MQQIEFRAMGCQMLAAVDSDEARAAEALAQVPAWFAEWETTLSRFRPESELSRLNQSDGSAVRVSETLAQVLEQSLIAARASAGLVTPTVLNALEAAGYDRSFELMDRHAAIRAELPARVADWRGVEFDAATRTVRLPRGVRLDFGGIAKSWAADQAARRLSEFAPALVDAGGDIAISGTRANGAPCPSRLPIRSRPTAMRRN
jgi:thiamine biosynthesis lipoprotein